jgi:hypothetical protein
MPTDLPGKRKLTTLEAALKEVVDHEFTQLTVEVVGKDDDDNDVTMLVCPHCQSQLGDDAGDLIAVDYGKRYSPSTEWTGNDLELQQVRFTFLDTPEEHIPYVREERRTVTFEGTLYYLCGVCGDPVGLPRKYEEAKYNDTGD